MVINKLRKVLVGKNQDYSNYLINIPKEIGILFEEVYFNIKKSGTTIILTSGCKIKYTDKQIEAYQFGEDNNFK